MTAWMKTPLISVSWCLELADSTRVQPYGMVKDVLIEVRDSSIFVDFIVIDMDPRQKNLDHPRKTLSKISQRKHQ
jgi:hypothetical protein